MRIGVDKVLAIAEYFGVTVEELYDKPVVQKIEEMPARARTAGLSAEESELIRLWRDAMPEGRAAALPAGARRPSASPGVECLIHHPAAQERHPEAMTLHLIST